MEIRFFVDKNKQNATGEVQIMLTVHHKGERWRKSTGERCFLVAWDHEGQRVKKKGKQQHAAEINDALKHKAEICNQIYRWHVNKRLPFTRESFTRQWNEIHHIKTDERRPTSFFEMFDYIKAKYKATKSANTLRQYDQVKKRLLEFNPSLSFADIDFKFYDAYLSYLFDEAGLKNNTVTNHIKRIKQVMKEAQKLGIKVKADYLDFTYMHYKPKPFWLTWQEVEMIEHYECIQQVDKDCKDAFLLRCYTGIRHSDYDQLTAENFITESGNLLADFTTIKTAVHQKIALPDKAVALAKKYDFKLPKHTHQTENKHIKLIAKAAGIKGKVQRVSYRGSQRITETFERWELVTTHTARRTFARRWIDRGGSIEKLCAYLGQSSTAITMQYIGFDSEEINQELKNIF